ncbi:NACHT domain-containing protein [Pseudanabaena sp. FACHB-1998]|uniref:NACHT domain-containing protein n=1 Tax=Pseudanabaena sp. FACHB-1998 TaxID=2692858 RepID=UPI00168027DC|nr:NACHT domain-containing protein [Pseudanabaena sp. FACHB-1998]MBD2177118.1 NACHT domain-containing protein [Pseudanabaena sp. FACHB-1998]
MTAPEYWDEFLENIATRLRINGQPKNIFVTRFAWKNCNISNKKFLEWLESNEIKVLHPDIYRLSLENYNKCIGQAYDIFENDKENGCLELVNQGNRKRNFLLEWLKDQYGQWFEEQKSKFADSSIHQQTNRNWYEVCCNKLDHWKKRNIDLVIGDNRLDFDNIDRTFVPLGFLEKVQKENSQSKNADQSGKEQAEGYEITQKYERQQDFLDVIIHGDLSESISKKQVQRLAVIGETGSGKTTLLLQIGYELLKQPNNLVIWISLKEVRDKQKSIWDYILEEWLKGSDIDRNEWKQEFDNKLKDGYVWLLLDGLEDISDRAYSVIGQFDDWLSKSKIALTCRKNRWDSDKADFASFDYGIYECIGYNSEQPSNFIDAWFGDDSESANGLKLEIQQATRHRINDLIKYPLHLSLLCSIYEKSESNFALAATKAELFDQFIKKQYKRKITKDRFDVDLVKSLGELAIKAIDTQSPLTDCEVREKLSERLEKALELGWLKPIDEYEQVYDFLHDSFKEYFAALEIPNWKFFLPDSLDNFKGNDYPVFDIRWREVILFWFGRKGFEKDKEDFIEALINFEDGCCDSSIVNGKSFYGYRAYFLAASCLSEFKNCSKDELITKRIIEWGFGCLNEENEISIPLPSINESAINILPYTNLFLATKYLCEILSNPKDEKSRLYLAARNLVKISIDSESKDIAVNTLIDLIKDPNDKDTRNKILLNLNKFIVDSKSKEIAIKVLSQIIKDANDEDIILFSASTSLGIIATDLEYKEIAINKLIDLMESTTDDNLICISAYSLCNITTDCQNKEIAVNKLIQLLENHSTNNDTICRAVYFLTKIVTNFNYKNLAVKSLIRIIEDSSTDIDALSHAVKLLEGIDNDFDARSLIINRLNCLINDPNTDEETRNKSLIRLLVIPNNINDDNEEKMGVIDVMISSKSQNMRIVAARNLPEILKDGELQPWLSLVVNLRNYLYKSLRNQENLLESYAYYESIFYCAQNMSYPEFYEAWHSSNRSNNSKFVNTHTIQTLESQFIDCDAIQKALGNTDHPEIRCLVVDVRYLEQESDPNVIAEEIAIKIFDSLGREIPEINRVSNLKRELINLKRVLGFEKLAIALYAKNANEAIDQLCQSLTESIQIRPFIGEKSTQQLTNEVKAWLRRINLEYH